MATSPYDKKAAKILFDAFWSSAGWKDGAVSAADFAYAKDHGLMFDNRAISHDELVQASRKMAQAISPLLVADAFLASLNSREMAYRSGLGSFAAVRTLPNHKFQPGRSHHLCQNCGSLQVYADEDINVLNFERLKWGGVRHLQLIYASFDLAEFCKLPPAKPKPEDRDVLKKILDEAASQPADARPNNLEKAISGLFPSSKDERRVVLQILGICGILQPSNHPGFFHDYACHDDRRGPDESKNDWAFPMLWWRGRDGVNQKALTFYFPDL